MNTMNISIVGTQECVPCQSVKKMLDKLGKEYTYFDFKSEDRTERLAAKRILKGRAYPLITIDGEEYVGFTEEVQQILNK